MPEYLFPGVYVEEIEAGPHPIEGVSTSKAAFLGTTRHGRKEVTLVRNYQEFEKVYGGYLPLDVSSLAFAVEGFFQNGGRRCYVARVDSDADYQCALEKFEPIEDISIVVAPDYHKVPSLGCALVEHCTRLQNRVVVLHSRPGVDTQGGLYDIKPPVDSPFAAFYLPWINVRNQVSGQVSTVPPSGHIAGVFARVDAEHGVHKSPANEVLRGVESLEFSITDMDQDALKLKGVNAIRDFPGRGIRVAGARTTATAPEWRYVAIRRYISYLQQSIDKGLEWVVFEPNREDLWGNVQATISDFLYSEWSKGALAGAKPEQAYFVKVDRSTMTQDDILNGRLIVIVGVAPLRPSEFVMIRIGRWTAASK